jgi:Protein of unknown function (DUF5818)
MHNRNRAIAGEGLLALLTFSLMLGVAARSLQSQPDASPSPKDTAVVLAQQEPQSNPTQKPDAPGNGAQAENSAVFTGTIIKNGSDFVLRDESGTVYTLDARSKAQQYAGKPVKVTGRLEDNARRIHVESIEEIAV